MRSQPNFHESQLPPYSQAQVYMYFSNQPANPEYPRPVQKGILTAGISGRSRLPNLGTPGSEPYLRWPHCGIQASSLEVIERSSETVYRARWNTYAWLLGSIGLFSSRAAISRRRGADCKAFCSSRLNERWCKWYCLKFWEGLFSYFGLRMHVLVLTRAIIP